MSKLLQDLNIEELREQIAPLKQPNFREGQLFEWLNRGAEFEQMTNLPKSFIQELNAIGYVAQSVKIEKTLLSQKDMTKKYIFSLCDNNVIEGVFMKHKYGNTVCISTQVGCRMNCAFCASGVDGLVRNLTAGEILGQVIAVNRDNMGNVADRAVTNIVLMGSGEPLDNYDNVTKFLKLVSDEKGLNISKRNISLSTCGLCDKIYKLADDGFAPILTISLHAPNDEIRAKIMPVAKAFSIKEIVSAARYYFDKTGRRIIFEYSMIGGVNDSTECAVELARQLRGLSSHVNLITLNYVKERGLKGSSSSITSEFLKTLEKNNISCSTRRTMGDDIEGACGQLRQSYLEKKE